MIARKELPSYTYADYATWKGDWELFEGIPYAMSSAKRKHQLTAGLLHFQILSQLQNCPTCNVYFDLDWIISDTSILRPDLFIFCGLFEDDFLRETPHFIIEILSKSTAEKDRGLKFRIYQEKKVLWYLLVDTDEQTITIFQLQHDTYVKIATLGTESYVFELPDCKFELDFGEIWVN